MFFVLKKRSDFLSISQNAFFFKSKYVLAQICVVNFEGFGKVNFKPLFFGVTASKKVGNSVKRNKAKRRIRALFRNEAIGISEKVNAFSLSDPLFTLSKKTSEHFFKEVNQKFVDCSDSCLNVGIAIVIIATKYTPEVKWNILEDSFKKLISDCVSKIICE